ncbi:MAG TPA: methyltransferase domain-containing protein [Edaphobacter sp.]
MNPRVNFDRIARPYRILEYLTLGRSLERTRLHLLSQLGTQKNALVFGDGDGRFLARLLETYPELHATAIDSSAEMLKLLQQRCAPYADRLQIFHADAMSFSPVSGAAYDLVVTHFFLDCFEAAQIDDLIARLVPTLEPGTLWLLSDFRVPQGVLQLPTRMMIRSLYLIFRILTGLRTTRLPRHDVALSKAGFERIDQQTFLAGILTTELWRRA